MRGCLTAVVIAHLHAKPSICAFFVLYNDGALKKIYHFVSYHLQFIFSTFIERIRGLYARIA